MARDYLTDLATHLSSELVTAAPSLRSNPSGRGIREVSTSASATASFTVANSVIDRPFLRRLSLIPGASVCIPGRVWSQSTRAKGKLDLVRSSRRRHRGGESLLCRKPICSYGISGRRIPTLHERKRLFRNLFFAAQAFRAEGLGAITSVDHNSQPTMAAR